MTCKQLGGACEAKFTADTFDEIAMLSGKHGMESTDEAHGEAKRKIGEMMMDPTAMQSWMEEKKAEFDSLPEDK